VKIAQIAPPWFTVPPHGYGGIELVVSLLADGLADAGHDVTLFASGGSTTRARLVSPLPEAPEPEALGDVWSDTFHATASYLGIDDSFDIVHDHSGIVGPTIGSMHHARVPLVHTLHGPWTQLARRYYALLHERIHLVAISAAQQADNPTLRYAGVVHNGIDLRTYPFREHKDEFLVYIGRANADKGPTIAIQVARQAGLPLVMIAKRNEPAEREYWDRAVAPMLGEDVRVYEGVPHELKADLLGRAKAMVFPIQWPEPFGLVMVEAMACGTPVVACPCGAAVELIEDGVTGYLRTAADELVDAVGRVGDCSAQACRDRVARSFSAEAMVAGYERVYAEVLRGHRDRR
jgi:glycosyltransferase involved in cell wall biosynthesis